MPENEPSPALEPPRHAEPNHGRHATEPETSALPWPGHRGRTHAGRHHGPGRPRLRSECRLLLHTDTQLAINFDGLIHVETAQQAEATAADDDPKTDSLTHYGISEGIQAHLVDLLRVSLSGVLRRRDAQLQRRRRCQARSSVGYDQRTHDHDIVATLYPQASIALSENAIGELSVRPRMVRSRPRSTLRRVTTC